MRRAARIDANQPEIVKALRQAGATVHPLHMVGGDFPDLIVGHFGVNVLMEIKDGGKPPSKRKLSDGQKEFRDNWNGPVVLVKDVEGALRVLRVIEASVCAACGGFVRVDVEAEV
jgi:hypothetical protein